MSCGARVQLDALSASVTTDDDVVTLTAAPTNLALTLGPTILPNRLDFSSPSNSGYFLILF